MTEIAHQVSSLTLAEKAGLTSGETFWRSKAIDRLGIASILMSDGPHGVRKQSEDGDHLGLGGSEASTCFPPAVALGSTFDRDLLESVGVALGREAQAKGVGVLLGPGINIKRSPLCGRNFEYLSEDPVISGTLGAALVRGVQSQGVGASLKHFAANNQEHDRLRVSADIDERPLREIYLRGFQKVVTQEQPWTVMCSYNRLNGVYTSENPWLLNDVLRGEWGFAGLVVSDWGAVNDRVAGVAAGLDLEMPTSSGYTDRLLVAAVEAGTLDEAVLDTAASRVIDLVRKVEAGARPDAPCDYDEHHALAREVAGRCVVLLKNDGILPLAATTQVAVIGEFARTPRYQGAGSSLINPTRLDNALDELREQLGEVVFAPGFTLDGADAQLRDEAVAAASAADVAVVFLGLPPSAESEGYDREHIDLPAEQLDLLDAVLEVNSRTVVVLSHGAVVRLAAFADRVPAIVEGSLLGQAGGGALADVLSGAVNPSGRLAETIPLRLEDTPAFLDFPGEHGHVRYGEGLYVGYRWYDARNMAVQFPFGHGLSYTTFDYGDLAVSADADGVVVEVTVRNTGDRAGREVVQVYTSVPGSAVVRAPRELKGFASIALEAGESRRVAVPIARDDLAYWDTRVGRFVVEGGDYLVHVGASSRDLRATGTVAVTGDPVVATYTLNSTMGELKQHPVAGRRLEEAMIAIHGEAKAAEMAADVPLTKMLESIPVGRAVRFPGAVLNEAQVLELLAEINPRG